VSRVNVNTTDATTGATALLQLYPCVSRVCPGSPRSPGEDRLRTKYHNHRPFFLTEEATWRKFISK